MCPLSLSLMTEPGADSQGVLQNASFMLKEKYGIHQSTLQVEAFQPLMEKCRTCQSDKSPRKKRKTFKFSRAAANTVIA